MWERIRHCDIVHFKREASRLGHIVVYAADGRFLHCQQAALPTCATRSYDILSSKVMSTPFSKAVSRPDRGIAKIGLEACRRFNQIYIMKM